MNTLQTLIAAAFACVLVSPPSVSARPIQQLEADIKLVDGKIRTCQEKLDALGKLIAGATNAASPPALAQLESWKAEHARNAECIGHWKNRLDTLQKELAAAPPSPVVMPAEQDPRRLLVLSRERVRLSESKIRQLAIKIKALEARLRLK